MKLPEERWAITLEQFPERTESLKNQLQINNVKGFNLWYGHTSDYECFYKEINDRFVIKNDEITPGGLGSLLTAYKLWEFLYDGA